MVVRRLDVISNYNELRIAVIEGHLLVRDTTISCLVSVASSHWRQLAL